MKNILFISHSDFPANSAVHVHYFANELIKLGLDCVVAVPHDQKSIDKLKGNLYKVTDFNNRQHLHKLFQNQQPPDLVHSWTPRQHVAQYCGALSVLYDFKLVIHLEDNEESVVERYLDVSLENWSAKFDRLLPDCLSHPLQYKKFMAAADGITVIIDKLKEFTPPTTSTITLYPGVDTQEFYPRAKNQKLLTELGIDKNATVLSYTGNIHLANIDEVRCLYLAVGKRNQENKPTVLIRTGIDNNLQFLNEDQLWIKQHVVELGWVERNKIVDILALADILVQPGEADNFNDYRFPSKIPEFLAMGKPVIIPKTNIGEVLTHEENALILNSVNEETLPPTIDLLMENDQLRQKLAHKAREFATENLSWSQSGRNLWNFYQSLFAEDNPPIPQSKTVSRVRIYHQEFANKLTQEVEDLKIENQELKSTQMVLQAQCKELTLQNQQIGEWQNNESINQQQIEELKIEIKAMKTSKFWKIREMWFKIKGLLIDN